MESNIVWYTVSMFKKRKARRSREFNKNNKIIDFEKARETRKEKREALAQNAQINKSEEPSKREKVKRNRKRFFYTAIMVIVVAVVGFSIYNIISVNSLLEETIAGHEALEIEKARLEYQLQHADSPEYIEQQARTMLRMVMPGETFYVVPAGEDEQ